MRIRTWITLMAIVAATTSAAAAADAQGELTTRQWRDLSPAEVNKQIGKDLRAVLQPAPRVESGMRLRVGTLYLTTAPYGTEFEGVCRRDTLFIHYAPTAQASAPKDQPVKAYGLTAQSSFSVAKLPVQERTPADGESNVWNADCAGLDHRDGIRWIAARDDTTAVRGVYALSAARAAVASGAITPAPCSSGPPAERAACGARLMTETAEQPLIGVEAHWQAKGVLQLKLSLGLETEITVVEQLTGGDLAPAKVDSVEIEKLMVIVD